VKTKKVPPVNDEQAARQFEMLMDTATENNYIHYEISNFAKDGWFSKHNSSYWKGNPYLGIGPSAHSFDGKNRQWNIAHNQKYLKTIEKGVVPFEQEKLTTDQRYNEYVMTSLRTIWGTELEKVADFGEKYGTHFLKTIQSFLQDESICEKNKNYSLTSKGKLLADRITMELFFDEK
jgi:oxygen-independent coproporphyrinogen-3 oxidase